MAVLGDREMVWRFFFVMGLVGRGRGESWMSRYHGHRSQEREGNGGSSTQFC